MQLATNVELTPRLERDGVIDRVFEQLEHWAEVSDVSVGDGNLRFTVIPRDAKVSFSDALRRAKDSFPGVVMISMRKK